MVELRAIQTDPDTLKTVISDVVQEQLNRQKEMNKKDEQIQKILRKEAIAAEVNKKPKESHDFCPNCQDEFEKLDDTVKVCKGCGSTVVKKGESFFVCDTCGGTVPTSFLNTNKPCPHCGGTKVSKP